MDFLKNNFKFAYKKNKYLIDYLDSNKARDLKFLTLTNYLNNLSKTNSKINKIRYYYKNILNYNELQFLNTPFNKYNNYIINIRNVTSKLGKFSLNSYNANYFFNNYALSVFRLNTLIYRYYYPYFFRWEYLKKLDNYNSSELLLKNRNLILNKEIIRNIKKNLIYISLRIKAFNIYKKHKIAIKGVSNYFLIGNNKLKTLFIDRFWSYSKVNFNYPYFFYLNNLNNKFNLYNLISIDLFAKNKSINIINYFFYFIRIFSIYQKYFFSFYRNDFLNEKLLYLKYDSNKKRIFWN